MTAMMLSVVLCGALAATAGALRAQTAVHAMIPFAFDADGTKMPAGRYDVLPAGSPKVVILRAEGTGSSVTLDRMAVDRYAAGCSCLRFHRYADGSLVLSDINLGQKAPSLELVWASRRSREEFPVGAVQISLRAN